MNAAMNIMNAFNAIRINRMMYKALKGSAFDHNDYEDDNSYKEAKKYNSSDYKSIDKKEIEHSDKEIEKIISNWKTSEEIYQEYLDGKRDSINHDEVDYCTWLKYLDEDARRHIERYKKEHTEDKREFVDHYDPFLDIINDIVKDMDKD